MEHDFFIIAGHGLYFRICDDAPRLDTFTSASIRAAYKMRGGRPRSPSSSSESSDSDKSIDDKRSSHRHKRKKARHSLPDASFDAYSYRQENGHHGHRKHRKSKRSHHGRRHRSLSPDFTSSKREVRFKKR